jgi:hypothetical protein
VLEDADLSSSNHVTVSDAFEAACVGRTDLSDEVHQISTVTSQWTVWPLKQDDRIELGEMHPDFAADAPDVVTG